MVLYREITPEMLKPRQRAFLKALPKNKGAVKPSAIEAGYSESYADKQGKLILQSAVKEQAREIVRQLEGKEMEPQEVKRAMYEVIGFSREELLNNVKEIATQEKDYRTRFLIVSQLARELGLQLKPDDEAQKTITPVLNLTIERVEHTNEDIIEAQAVNIDPEALDNGST